jgi:hypothetical protein
MRTEYCGNCGYRRGFKRNLGIGTILMLLLTFGWWLVVIPFYPVRCIQCGVSYSDIALWKTLLFLLFLLVVGFCVYLAITV